jgi:beta-galactosidase/beta-glucuronidase
VYVDGKITDEKYDYFGFRTVEFTVDKGFLLNGKQRYINGICGHEDFGLTGKAVPDNIMRYKVRMLKEMGVNAYRCAHSMQDEALMDAFDQYGMMVMAETRHFSTSKTHLEELRALIRRDRNRPSVFMWSVGNEEHYFITDEGRRIAEHMIFEVKKLDHTRPVITANDKKPEECTVYESSDLIGVNYNHGLYDYLHEKFPNIKKINVTALDGNQHALRLYENVITRMKSIINIKINNRIAPIVIDDFYDMDILDGIINSKYDIIISFKAICELVTKEQFEGRNPYEHIAKIFLPKLENNGLMLLVDVTSYNDVSQEWLPMITSRSTSGRMIWSSCHPLLYPEMSSL